MPPFKAAVIQHACTVDATQNRARSAELIHAAARRGARLVLLPELHAHAYFCQTEHPDHFDLAETIPGPTTRFFGELARQHQLVLVISLFEKRLEGLCHNTAVVLEKDGGIAGIYRKMHIPDDPSYYEKYYFTPGDLGFTPIDTSIGRLGVLVCWDQWFPEAARLMALAGAEILLYPAAIGWDRRDDTAEQQRQLEAWSTIQRAHAIANHLPLLAANRTGHEADPSAQTPGIEFWGHGFIAGPQGEWLARAESGGDTCLVTEINPERTRKLRRNWPFLRDRRIDAYARLTGLGAGPQQTTTGDPL